MPPAYGRQFLPLEMQSKHFQGIAFCGVYGLSLGLSYILTRQSKTAMPRCGGTK